MGRFHSVMTRFARSRRSLLLLLAVLSSCTALLAQDAPPPPDNNSPYVLHVYANLLQIPVLILKQDTLEPAVFKPRDLTLRLDRGKPFHPTLVRPEGDDPITLAIVADMSGPQFDLTSHLKAALLSLPENLLTTRDRVLIFGYDCNVVRVGGLETRPTPNILGALVDNLMLADIHRNGRKRETCIASHHLYDMLGLAIQRISGDHYGRHVILAMSDGYDSHSHFSMLDVRDMATHSSVAIFALPNSSGLPGIDQDLARFGSLCQSTGGMLRISSASTFPDHLQQFLKMVRSRFIVEFPRPRSGMEGDHVIEVEVARQTDFIRASGISVPLADPGVASDPTTINPDVKSDAPEIGNHHPKTEH